VARWRALELFCGLGGFAAAAGEQVEVRAAVDVSQVALGVYGHNFPHPTYCRAVESLSGVEIAAFSADLWWLSPPCQPYTRRGHGRGLQDPRGRGFLAVLDHLAELLPLAVALENVPEFSGSEAHRRLRVVLDGAGYEVAEQQLCPADLGLPNRRRRFYLVACRQGLKQARIAQPTGRRSLSSFLDPLPAAELRLSDEFAERYRGALGIVDAEDPRAITACFTSAYGRSHVRSGSYLRDGQGLRRFSPAEILRLLGFPADYRLPPELPLKNAWRLAGNSLSLPAVQAVLSRLPAAPS